jgi:hypothetical protein
MTLWRKTGWALVVLANAVLAQGCKEPIKGVALGLFDTELSSRAIRTELESIQALGANTISLPIYWYQQDVTSHEIRPYPEAGFDPVRYDDLVRTAIHQAHGVGLGVLLMPVVQLEQTGKGKWRGALQPVSWDLWFQSYEHFLLHYARLAQEEEVTLFSVGSELSSSEVHVTRWRALIDRVRAIYRGELTYSANWDHYHPRLRLARQAGRSGDRRVVSGEMSPTNTVRPIPGHERALRSVAGSPIVVMTVLCQ